MSELTSDKAVITIDRPPHPNNGFATIRYSLNDHSQLWEKYSYQASPTRKMVDVPAGGRASSQGQYDIRLKPDQYYEVAIYDFTPDFSPTHTPRPEKSLKIFCIWNTPRRIPLISDINKRTGGTWHFHKIVTNAPSQIVTMGVSINAPILDVHGIPTEFHPDQIPVMIPGGDLTLDHQKEFLPLLPGTRYFFYVVVADENGEWQYLQDEFTTLSRKINLEFKTLHVYNDGDPTAHGNAQFWYYVKEEGHVKEFYQSEIDIDDWSETDRPYPIGFTYFGIKRSAKENNFRLLARGIEYDGLAEVDEISQSRPHGHTRRSLNQPGDEDYIVALPVGQGETVTNVLEHLDCPTTNDCDFHFGVDVVYSVEYSL